jgi:hypothetical protein
MTRTEIRAPTGQKVDTQLRLLPVLWWSRGGKVDSFLGGATLILDLIGPDRLRALVRNRDRFRRTYDYFGPLTGRPCWPDPFLPGLSPA